MWMGEGKEGVSVTARVFGEVMWRWEVVENR